MQSVTPRRFTSLAFAISALVAASACAGGNMANLSTTQSANTQDLSANTKGALTAAISRRVCLDVVNNTNAPGAALQMWGCSGGVNQVFSIGQNNVKVFGDKCLTLAGTGDGAQVVLATCDASDAAQKWHVNDAQLIHDADGLCMDVRDGGHANGTRVQVWTCYQHNSNQSWVMPGAATLAPDADPNTPSVATTDANTVTVTATTTMPAAQTGQALVDASATQKVTFGDWSITGGFTAISLDDLLAKHSYLVPYRAAFLQAGAQAKRPIPPQLLVAIVLQESSGGQNVGSYGGPFQFTSDAAWNAYGPANGDRNKMADGAIGAANYIAATLSDTQGDLNAALREYNGPLSQGGNPDYQNMIQRWMQGELVYGSGV